MTLEKKLNPADKCIWKLILKDTKMYKDAERDKRFDQYGCEKCNGYFKDCRGYYPERKWWEA